MGVGFAAKQDLQAAKFFCATNQAFRITQQQVGPFVSSYAASKTNGEDVASQRDTSPLGNGIKQHALGLSVRLLDVTKRHVNGVTKLEIVFTPARDCVIKDGLHRSRSPGGGMHSVGDGIDRVF